MLIPSGGLERSVAPDLHHLELVLGRVYRVRPKRMTGAIEVHISIHTALLAALRHAAVRACR